ncbi:MAG: site-specific integrase [Varibaculum cambriense]|uniref:tyrosine-type recombinase/integrase n=1 Tax=Varibaculum cambriense TaxID=184870 RepID=UPI001ED2C52F|nr:site-specific integrase [Varibaculum cambriense]MBS5918024.1 site-specific integrase [Varibaculum cambriense]
MATSRFGRIRRLKSGRYRADYQRPDMQGIKTRSARITAPQTFAVKEAAVSWLTKEKAAIDAGTWKSPEQLAEEAEEAARLAEEAALTFGELAELSLAARRDRHATETYRKELSNYNHWIKPYWEKKPLKAITPQQVTAWLNTFDLTRPGYKRPLELFNAMMNEAVRDFELLEKNPAERPIYRLRKSGKKIHATKSQRHDPAPLTMNELIALADEITPPCLRLWVLLGGLLGLRAGELRGLTRSSFDWDKQLLTVDKATTGVGKTLDADAAPKTAKSNRILPIPPALAIEIKRHLEAFAAFGKDGLVFPSPRDPERPRDPTGIGQAMRRACKRLGIAERTSHDLRHSAASLLAEAGIPAVTVQAILGHAESSITRRYTHAFQEQTAKALNGLGDAFTSASAGGNVLQLPTKKGLTA